MDLSSIKLVVADMDGTLLNSKHEVSQRFFDLHEQLQALDIRFIAASGRQYHSIADKLQPIRDEIIIIAENGGLVMHRGQEMLSVPLPAGTREQALETIRNIGSASPIFCGKEAAYIEEAQQGDFELVLQEYYSSYRVLPRLEDHEGDLIKIAIYHPEDAESFIYPEVKQFEGDLKVKVSGAHWVDLSHQRAHKGNALEAVQRALAISPAETLVFGDYNNDLEMLSRSEHSVAMANAHPNVLEASKYRTGSNDEFGVEAILQRLLDQR